MTTMFRPSPLLVSWRDMKQTLSSLTAESDTDNRSFYQIKNLPDLPGDFRIFDAGGSILGFFPLSSLDRRDRQRVILHRAFHRHAGSAFALFAGEVLQG